MANARDVYNVDANKAGLADPQNKQFDLSFPYLSQSHVSVTVNGTATTAFTYATSTRIQLNTGPTAGDVVVIQRATSPNTRLVDYQTGSVLTEEILDQDSLQAFYLAQEAIDNSLEVTDAAVSVSGLSAGANPTGSVAISNGTATFALGIPAGAAGSQGATGSTGATGANSTVAGPTGPQGPAGSNYAHPNHSGEVTSIGDGATVIADNVVDEANIKTSNNPVNGYVLTAQDAVSGGMTWAAMAGGGQNAFSNVAVSGQSTVAADAATDTLNLAAGSNVTITTNAGSDTVTIAATDTNTNTTYSVGDGGLTTNDFTNADHSKLDGIEASATADQTDTEIRAAVGAASDSNVFTDADHSKLNAIAASATANPNALNNLSEDTSPQLGGALDVNGQDIASTSNGAINLDPHGSGKVVFKGNSTKGSGQFVLNCEANSHGITVKGPPHSANASYTLTLPNDDGTSGQSLITDGNGVTSWSTISGGSSYTLPIASFSTLGGIKVGGGLSVNNSSGLVQLNLPAANTSALGGVMEDASGPIAIANNGIMTINSNAINADQLNVSGNGSTSQYLRSDGDGTFTWATPTDTDTNTTYSVGDGGLTTNDFTNADHSKLDGVAASANNYLHPNHSGEVTSTADGATVIAGNVVDEANLKVSNSPTNGYMLTAQSGNTGGLTWAAAPSGGGADLYAANESSPSAQPSATGANAVAIGDGAVASGIDSFAGADCVATGRYAVALGKSRAGHSSSMALNIGNNTSSFGATAYGSIAIGTSAKASGYGSINIGGADTQAQRSIAIGDGSAVYNAGSELSLAINGGDCRALYGMAIGRHSRVNQIGQIAFGNGGFSGGGDGQSSLYILKSDTTNATAEAMTTNNSTAASNNQIVATSNTCIMFSGTIVAIQNGAQDQGGWEIKGLLKNDGGTTTLVSSNIQTFADGNSWAVSLSADNTNNALKVQVTGEASHNIRWVANIQTSECTFA